MINIRYAMINNQCRQFFHFFVKQMFKFSEKKCNISNICIISTFHYFVVFMFKCQLYFIGNITMNFVKTCVLIKGIFCTLNACTKRYTQKYFYIS